MVSAIKWALESVKLTPLDDKNSEKLLAKLISNNRTSQLTYEAFINKKRTLAKKNQAKWKKDCELKMRILTGGPFIYYLGNVLEPKTQDVQELRPMCFYLRFKLQILISVAFVNAPKKRLFTSFGIVPWQELFGTVPKISWFQLIWWKPWDLILQGKKEIF